MDKLTPKQRHKNMQAVKSKNSKIELLLDKELSKLGYKYIRNNSSVFGKPDFTFDNYKIAIFCDGEFWHGRNWKQHKKDHKSNKEFWFKKIESNIKRDKLVNKTLTKQGWNVMRFWESDIEGKLILCVNKIRANLLKNKKKEETIKKYLENDNEKMALISHYLHNKNICNVETYYNATKFMNNTNNFYNDEPCEAYNFLPELFSIPFPQPGNYKFTFIDLFAGIGGFRIAMQNLGGKCVFSSEWDKQAQKTYFLNFGELPFGDITKEQTKKYIPDNFDILCAGFPCQAFSLAGKKLGFNETRGTLFFDVAEIIRRKKPKAFFLENVKGLKIHDKGKTLKVILNTLKELGYFVPNPQIMNAANFGVPQHRERIYIVGFRKDMGITDFSYPDATDNTKKFIDIREKQTVSAKYYLSTCYQKTLINHKKRHENKGNGFGYEIIPDTGIANAIVVGGMGRERNLVIDKRLKDFTPVTKIKGEINRDGWRRMTPREWARLQGFPENFKIEVADASAYKQFGNSVAIPAIQETAKKILEKIIKEKK